MNSEIIAAFNFRHATKRFDETKKIKTQDFDTILEAARLSPSSYGFEPWSLIVVQDTAIRNELREQAWGAQGQAPTASHFVVITAKTSELLQPDGGHIDHILQTVKHSSPQAIAGTKRRYASWIKDDFKLDRAPELLHDWAAKQAYIALGNMMSVAALLGIDSCPIEGFNIDNATSILAAHELIDPKVDLPVAYVAFGYRKDAQPQKKRRPLSEVVQWV